MRADVHAVAVGRRPVADYALLAGDETIQRILDSARPLAGARVVHVTASSGGRPPEMLDSLLPLVRGLGVEVEWRVLFGDAPFLAVGDALQDGLQGAEIAIDADEWAAYRAACDSATRSLPECDVLVVHDPRALGAADAREGARRIWRCHVDASEPDAEAWERARPLVERCDAAVFSAASFAPPGLRRAAEDPGASGNGNGRPPPGPDPHAISPAIDPLSPANLELPVGVPGRIARSLGIDLGRPYCCQVIGFDPWKDPHEAIDAFRLAKEEVPELQLVLAGALRREDAPGWLTVREIADYADGVQDVHLLTSYTGVGNLELNAVRRLARVALQKSLREGFGLAASEAMWAGTPVVGSPAGGLPLQVRDGRDGYLTEGTEETARRIVELVRDPALAVEMGRSGRDRVRERFLMTRLLEDELRLLAEALAEDRATVAP